MFVLSVWLLSCNFTSCFKGSGLFTSLLRVVDCGVWQKDSAYGFYMRLLDLMIVFNGFVIATPLSVSMDT